MWETAETSTETRTEAASAARHLSHDRPCSACGHAMHFYLPCSDSCACTPQLAPGLPSTRSTLVTV
ncbi:hypothetical protein [Nocardioides sp. LHG3406-4]|uniref:hypothetical protein n=1 Tax=Nocardioides sp. LHG3406-4 TaxID=2804575 RepID=UPI003CE7F59A